MRDGDGVDVGVDDPGVRVGLLGDLVHVALGRDAGADVEELPDARGAEEPHGVAEELAVGPREGAHVGLDGQQRPAEVLIGQEVVAAA